MNTVTNERAHFQFRSLILIIL